MAARVLQARSSSQTTARSCAAPPVARPSVIVLASAPAGPPCRVALAAARPCAGGRVIARRGHRGPAARPARPPAEKAALPPTAARVL